LTFEVEIPGGSVLRSGFRGAPPGNILIVGAWARRREARGGTSLDLRVVALPQMVAQVRLALGELPLPAPLLEDARLLASEMVTNSIRHAGLQQGDRIQIRARWSGSRLRVDVIDGGRAGLSAVAGAIRPAPRAESGWGLFLVERLASRWGYAPGRYWFELEH
jgi:anti-sigma regulatory factor (Ser/Thr protein kinase)